MTHKQIALVFSVIGCAVALLASRSGIVTFDDLKKSIDDSLTGIKDDFTNIVENVTPTPITSGKWGTIYDDLILKSADDFGVEPDLLYRLLKQESAFSPEVIFGQRKSSVGALGIAQFMPATAIQELGSVGNALNPEIAIPGAARYLAKLRRITGDWKSAVAAYNWGVGNVQRKGLDKAPAETLDYINRVYYA
jgi:soluble lytic murein transglycosylase-like protein